MDWLYRESASSIFSSIVLDELYQANCIKTVVDSIRPTHWVSSLSFCASIANYTPLSVREARGQTEAHSLSASVAKNMYEIFSMNCQSSSTKLGGSLRMIVKRFIFKRTTVCQTDLWLASKLEVPIVYLFDSSWFCFSQTDSMDIEAQVRTGK